MWGKAYPLALSLVRPLEDFLFEMKAFHHSGWTRVSPRRGRVITYSPFTASAELRANNPSTEEKKRALSSTACFSSPFAFARAILSLRNLRFSSIRFVISVKTRLCAPCFSTSLISYTPVTSFKKAILRSPASTSSSVSR
jgi:hypothetical protein